MEVKSRNRYPFSNYKFLLIKIMSFGAHFSSLVKKNFIIWKRGICGSFCEFVLPVFFAYFYIVMRNSSEITTIP